MHEFFQVAKYITRQFSQQTRSVKNANADANKVKQFSVHVNQSKTTVPDRTIGKPRSNFTAGLSERPLAYDASFFTGEFSKTSPCFAVSK